MSNTIKTYNSLNKFVQSGIPNVIKIEHSIPVQPVTVDEDQFTVDFTDRVTCSDQAGCVSSLPFTLCFKDHNLTSLVKLLS